MTPYQVLHKTLAEVDTPSLLVDADALEANLHLMASYFATRPCKLRPHLKSHKCTRIAKLQMQAGAVGITCAKLGEAEVVADAGIREILIANQIVGRIKIARLVELAKRADPIVAVDSRENVRTLSAVATAADLTLGVLVEVDIGMNRCGVKPGPLALDLVRLIASLPGLSFEGLQGYEGHLVDIRDETERAEKTRGALKLVVKTRRLIEQAGIKVNIVSGGGTGTYTITGNYPGVDEVQAGWWYSDIRPEFRQAQSILATIISRRGADTAIVDVGRKGVGAEFGPPRVKDLPGAKIASFGSEEHAAIALPENHTANVGDHIELIPSHGCTTSNLYREYIVHRNGIVTDVWPIEGSGRMQ
jgi:D-serine deaminase-like pyridoxal phosphate-dependent protein